MDGRDRNFGVDFLLLSSSFYLISLDSPITSNYYVHCNSPKLVSLPDTLNFKLSFSFHEKCKNLSITD